MIEDKRTYFYNTELELQKDYWTYSLEVTKDGSKLSNITKVFKTKLIEIKPGSFGFLRLIFEELPVKLAAKQSVLRNMCIIGPSAAYCKFYLTEQEAKEAFDNQILELSNNKPVVIRDKMTAHLYDKTRVANSELEIEAKQWLATLPVYEKKYFDWLIKNL